MPDVKSEYARLIGEKLRAVRKERRLSLRELAAQSRISASMLSQIETGKRNGSVRALGKIAAALRVDVDDILPRR